MSKLPNDYIQRVYAGWLGKVIGVRYGAPVEMWTDERIAAFYGELDGYVTHYADFAADDDTNGPLFFVRALEDYACDESLTAEQIGKTLLNYVPYEHGFFWWGGYGVSAEHTVYTNLRSGIMAPRSGSAAQNGSIVAGQIGGQIFIDCWGFVCPCDYRKAARFAQKAASVAWDGDGVYGGMFVAACVSAAFEDGDVRSLISKGLSVIPGDSGYAAAVRDVAAFYDAHPQDWRECLAFVKKHYWMDKYIGNCHIIPNAAIIVLSMLYGGGDFTRSLNICNMCGFDTDCNVGNLGAILGVARGLDSMDHGKWFPEINDFQAASSVVGSLNITDLPGSAQYFAGLGYRLAGETPPEPWRARMEKPRLCHFELPGSTHAVRAALTGGGESLVSVRNTDEDAFTGSRCLKISAQPFSSGSALKVFVKTYYEKSDFANGRYEPVVSPIAYPGQTVSAAVRPADGGRYRACLYALDRHTGESLRSELVPLDREWRQLSFLIPAGSDACIGEVGVWMEPDGPVRQNGSVSVFVDDLCWEGQADYTVNLEKEHNWSWFDRDARTEMSQFTRLRGTWHLQDGEMTGYCPDFGETYTGDVSWRDYRLEASMRPLAGDWHAIGLRVQGAVRSYAAALTKEGLSLMKNEDGVYRALATVPFAWRHAERYAFALEARGNTLAVFHEGRELIRYTDADHPYLHGMIGAAISGGGSCAYGSLTVRPLDREA